jgi:hypothetical protein
MKQRFAEVILAVALLFSVVLVGAPVACSISVKPPRTTIKVAPVALAFAATADGSNAHSGAATSPASTGAQLYCADLQQVTSVQGFQLSGWRCKQGPLMRGYETILGWVTMADTRGKAHVELVWLVEMRPARDAPVIDARKVPYYGYEPTDVRAAFRTPAGDHLSA